VLFNRFEPFYVCMMLYVTVAVLGFGYWLFSGTRFGTFIGRTATGILILTLLVHSLGLVARVYLSGRPPVTNLYSSAIFIAWAGVVLCVGLELVYRNGIASVVGAALAAPSLIIAHYLAADGDTMKMLQAVLDTNFWLATHVVVVTLGYAATFLAGVLGIAYVIAGIFTRGGGGADSLLTKSRVAASVVSAARAPVTGWVVVSGGSASLKTLSRMIYGIVCFAMLFSFVGTILGGIWADQSWGRFWGWDPKENGAVLIVLWNAIVLHARWGGLVKDRGVALLAIFGNVVTAWSWFGTNMLGIGLHSYGFMDKAMFWLVTFVVAQLGLILIGSLVPTNWWRSFSASTAEPQAAR
jgi:cytochrome c-type biogenesis protein CcsB